jgi:hypothetical protein
MINIIAPPGCYGTYISRCLHHYTSTDGNYLLDFDTYGSSHAFRELSSSIKKSSLSHWHDDNDVQAIDADNTVIITCSTDHHLDYYDNQFYKQSRGNLVEYMTETAGIDTIQDRLQQGWQYTNKFDDNIPRWIIREYCSFWQSDCWAHSYNNSRYLSLPHVYNFSCQDLWDTDMWQLMNTVGQKLKKKIHAPEDTVHKNHLAFLNCQKYHGIQQRCEQFVKNTIDSVHTDSPCISVFDEAYVQYLLRVQGYEILCHDLNQFPTTSTQLAKTIYETMHNTNT